VSTYRLTTHWRLGAPVPRVWDAIAAPGEWPRWWRYVQAVRELEPGDAHGIGALRRFTWSSRLPLLAPVFAWNHHAVMRAGGEGLARHLGVPWLGFRAAQA
jgi:hypothetical protein